MLPHGIREKWMCCPLTPPCSSHDHAVKKELEGKDITLLVEGGLKTKEDLGEHVPIAPCYFWYFPRWVALECAQRSSDFLVFVIRGLQACRLRH